MWILGHVQISLNQFTSAPSFSYLKPVTADISYWYAKIVANDIWIVLLNTCLNNFKNLENFYFMAIQWSIFALSATWIDRNQPNEVFLSPRRFQSQWEPQTIYFNTKLLNAFRIRQPAERMKAKEFSTAHLIFLRFPTVTVKNNIITLHTEWCRCLGRIKCLQVNVI